VASEKKGSGTAPVIGRVEHVGADVSVRELAEQRRREHRKAIPAEDRHPEHRHSRGPQADDRGQPVDRTEDGAQPGHDQPAEPEVGAGPAVRKPDMTVSPPNRNSQ